MVELSQQMCLEAGAILVLVGEEIVVIEKEPMDGVDIVGNVLDPPVLEEAGVRNAQAVILALTDDAATMFATVILKNLAPDVPVIARVNHLENIERIYGAGAEFALSISQVSGQILAWRLLGKQAISVDPEFKVLKTQSDKLTGHHPAELNIRQKTGCSIVAVERGEELLLEFGQDFRFAQADTVYICGSTEATRKFEDIYNPAGKRRV